MATIRVRVNLADNGEYVIYADAEDWPEFEVSRAARELLGSSCGGIPDEWRDRLMPWWCWPICRGGTVVRPVTTGADRPVHRHGGAGDLGTVRE